MQSVIATKMTLRTNSRHSYLELPARFDTRGEIDMFDGHVTLDCQDSTSLETNLEDLAGVLATDLLSHRIKILDLLCRT